MNDDQIIKKFIEWRKDWNRFAYEMLQLRLDKEQRDIIDSLQHNPRTSVVSGTARGKDYVTAAGCICFLYLTPEWDTSGEMIGNTKVAMTAPTDRQVGNIMFPEISRMFNKAKHLPGRLVGYDIRTGNKEWFLTGFKADEHQHEAWSGFHAVNTMFAITEASGVADTVFEAIEGNLQGNSRILLVFNFNRPVGYAADSQRSAKWAKYRLNSLTAPNVIEKKIIYPGQVDYTWVKDRIDLWCIEISKEESKAEENDFEFESKWYRPNDLFRVKVLGVSPKVGEGVLVPPEWIDLANERWRQMQTGIIINARGWTGTPAAIAKMEKPLRLGADVAGMGRDNSMFVHRYGNYVDKFKTLHAAGKAEHMQVAGIIKNALKQETDLTRGTIAQSFIDTIGEGAGVYSRLVELAATKEDEWLKDKCHSVKFSEKAEWHDLPLKDATGQYEFLNMRAYLMWAVRDWLDPQRNNNAALPPSENLKLQLTQTLWKFQSNGKIQIEAKDEIKKRIKMSPDEADALANTFYPVKDIDPNPKKAKSAASFFPR